MIRWYWASSTSWAHKVILKTITVPVLTIIINKIDLKINNQLFIVEMDLSKNTE